MSAIVPFGLLALAMVALLAWYGWWLRRSSARMAVLDTARVHGAQRGIDIPLRRLMQEAADLARVGTPEALALRESVNELVDRLQEERDRIARTGKVRYIGFLEEFHQLLQKTETLLGESDAPQLERYAAPEEGQR